MAEKDEEKESDDGLDLENEYTKKLRFENQCFLTDAVRFFTEKNKDTSYSNFVVLDAQTSKDAATLVSRANSKFGINGAGLRSFLTITPSEFATLVPKIRLYVLKYKHRNDGKGIQQELVFADWTGKQTIENIMKSATGRGDGAGISKFTYEFDGRDPATTENLIKASVTISFTDFGVLANPIRGLNAEEIEYFGVEKENSPPSYLDLVTRFSPKNPESVYTKLRASIGWQPPQDSVGNTIRPELKQFITEGHANMDLILYMTGHDLTFKENGRVDLKVEFRAALENLINGSDADVLSLGGLGKKRKALIDKAFDKKKKANKERADEAKKRVAESAERGKNFEEPGIAERAIASVGEALGGPPAGGINAIEKDTEDREEEIENLAEAARQIEAVRDVEREKLRMARYRKFLDELNNSEKIHYIDISTDSLKNWVSGVDAFDATSRNRYTATKAISEGDGTSTGVTKKADKDNNPAARGAKAAKEADKEANKKAQGKSHKKIQDIQKEQGTPEIPADVHRIYYVYLGDIINIAASVLEKSDKWHGATRLVTGPVQFDDPSTPDPRTVIENIADLPIALDTFVEWYYDKVIAKAIETYSLKSFLNDIMKDLIYRSLGGQCFRGLTKMPSFSLTPIVLNMTIDGESSVEPVKKQGGVYPRQTVSNFARNVRNNLRRDPSNTVTYMLLTAVYKHDTEFNDGDTEKDEKFGIYHFGIGRDRGLINTIKFQKVKMKYRKEALVLDQGNIGIGQLREVYDANISMVGNTLFRNGQYLYIDPTTMGVKTKTALELVMGGYYVITRVNGELSADGYETTLTCKYNSKKRKTSKKSKISKGAKEDGSKTTIDKKP